MDVDSNNITIVETTTNTSILISDLHNLVPNQDYIAHVTTVLNSCTTDTAVRSFTFEPSPCKPLYNYWICRKIYALCNIFSVHVLLLVQFQLEMVVASRQHSQQ